MKEIGSCFLAAYMFVLSPAVGATTEHLQRSSPQAGGRTYAQNFKDMVLATCLANAYAKDPHTARDAGSSASALRDWSYYDLEKAPDAIKALVADYLSRDYSNPLAESEMKGIRFDFLKCMDLYHSQALDSVARRIVMTPSRTYRQDNPATKPAK